MAAKSWTKAALLVEIARLEQKHTDLYRYQEERHERERTELREAKARIHDIEHSRLIARMPDDEKIERLKSSLRQQMQDRAWAEQRADEAWAKERAMREAYKLQRLISDDLREMVLTRDRALMALTRGIEHARHAHDRRGIDDEG